MFARPFIDSIDFARNGKELCGEIPVTELSRLREMLASSNGILQYGIRGLREKDRDLLELKLGGECQLRCQRCLAEFSHPVKIISCLQLLAVGDLDVIDDEIEVDYIEASTHLDVLTLIEDEVLLGLPFAPKHPAGECSPTPAGLQQSTNPFAALVSLKKQN